MKIDRIFFKKSTRGVEPMYIMVREKEFTFFRPESRILVENIFILRIRGIHPPGSYFSLLNDWNEKFQFPILIYYQFTIYCGSERGLSQKDLDLDFWGSWAGGY